MANLSKFLFTVAKSRVGEFIIGWSFASMSFLIPIDRLYETEKVVAFYHPQPNYPIHILIVPKHRIRNLLAVTEAEMPIIQDVIFAAQHLVEELGLEEGGFRLVVNGGAYQDVSQIHWHLISDEEKALLY